MILMKSEKVWMYKLDKNDEKLRKAIERGHQEYHIQKALNLLAKMKLEENEEKEKGYRDG